MDEKDIQKVIEDTVNAAFLRLKAEGLLRDSTKSAYAKTEAVLWQYPQLKGLHTVYATRLVAEVDACMEAAQNKPYVDVIRLFYFAGEKNAACAKLLHCDERTARRNRVALVKQFSARLASDDFIRELLT